MYHKFFYLSSGITFGLLHGIPKWFTKRVYYLFIPLNLSLISKVLLGGILHVIYFCILVCIPHGISHVIPISILMVYKN